LTVFFDAPHIPAGMRGICWNLLESIGIHWNEIGFHRNRLKIFYSRGAPLNFLMIIIIII